MEKIATENLFLLEFLVDKVNLQSNAVPAELAKLCQETCVAFQFLDNTPLDICEADFVPKREYDKDVGNLKSGKSCLFALTAQQAEDAVNTFDVDVGIFKYMQDGVLPEKLQVGSTMISISNLFNELIEDIRKKKGQPAAKTLKDCFPVANDHEEEVGNITVFIRMSCFGKLIVTQFQMNLEDKSVLFKDQEGNALYRYKKIKGCEDNAEKEAKEKKAAEDSCCCAANEAQPNRGPTGPQQQMRGPHPPCYPQPSLEDIRAMPPQYSCDAPRPQPMMTTNDLGNGSYQQQLQDQQCNQQCFQEIGAEMAGNALKIRVHKDPKTSVQKMSETGEWQQQEGQLMNPYNRQQYTGHQLTQMGMGMIPGQPGQIVPCVTGRPMDPTGMTMSPGFGSSNPVALKMASCPTALDDNNVTVIPPCPTGQDGLAQVTEIPDPTKDVFVLRIGKKTEGNDKRSNLELELQTPKGLERKPPAKKETRETQCEDIPEGGQKKGKGGKKGGKGDKKGDKGGKKGGGGKKKKK